MTNTDTTVVNAAVNGAANHTGIRKPGCVAARLTADQQERVKAAAKAAHMSVSEWVGSMLLEALDTTPMERRLQTFIAAEIMLVWGAMQAWQRDQTLDEESVRHSIFVNAAAGARKTAEEMAARLAMLEKKVAL